MKREVAERWIAALRSGEYERTEGCLYDGTGYCCLGVLEKLSGSEFERTDGNEYSYRTVGAGADHWLTGDTRKLSGMSSHTGRARDGFPIQVGSESFDSLSSANDDGCDFREIADAIERNWERL